MESTPFVRDPASFRGRVEMRPFESTVLRDNAPGDPHLREVPVYLPPAALEGERLPVVFLLPAFTSRPQSWLETHPWKSGVVLEVDRAMSAGHTPPAILVMPDAFTHLGGSQYVNSDALGRYEDYVARELVQWVDATYPTRAGRRALMGKSSGGFGALHLGMRHPDTFGVVASISGDCHFEYGYAGDFLSALRGLEAHGGDPEAFLEAFARTHDLSGDGHSVLSLLGMSACYSPNGASPLGFDLPIDLETGALIPEVWQRWLAFDPVVACSKHADALRSLDLLYLEAGTRDEFHLQFSLRVLARRLEELDIPFVHEEFEGGHFNLNERIPTLLPMVIRGTGTEPG